MNDQRMTPTQNLMNNFSPEIGRYLKEYGIQYSETYDDGVGFEQSGFWCEIKFSAIPLEDRRKGGKDRVSGSK